MSASWRVAIFIGASVSTCVADDANEATILIQKVNNDPNKEVSWDNPAPEPEEEYISPFAAMRNDRGVSWSHSFGNYTAFHPQKSVKGRSTDVFTQYSVWVDDNWLTCFQAPNRDLQAAIAWKRAGPYFLAYADGEFRSSTTCEEQGFRDSFGEDECYPNVMVYSKDGRPGTRIRWLRKLKKSIELFKEKAYVSAWGARLMYRCACFPGAAILRRIAKKTPCNLLASTTGSLFKPLATFGPALPGRQEMRMCYQGGYRALQSMFAAEMTSRRFPRLDGWYVFPIPCAERTGWQGTIEEFEEDGRVKERKPNPGMQVKEVKDRCWGDWGIHRLYVNKKTDDGEASMAAQMKEDEDKLDVMHTYSGGNSLNNGLFYTLFSTGMLDVIDYDADCNCIGKEARPYKCVERDGRYSPALDNFAGGLRIQEGVWEGKLDDKAISSVQMAAIEQQKSSQQQNFLKSKRKAIEREYQRDSTERGRKTRFGSTMKDSKGQQLDLEEGMEESHYLTSGGNMWKKKIIEASKEYGEHTEAQALTASSRDVVSKDLDSRNW